MRKIILFLFLFMISFVLSAQDSESLEELRLFAQSSVIKAEQVARGLDVDSIIMGDFLYNDSESPLGNLLGDLIVAEVTNSSTLKVVGNSGPLREEGKNWIIAEGVIYLVENAVYMQIKLIDSQNQTPLAVLEKTLDSTPLTSLLDTYYDDYYDDYSSGPVIEDDYFNEPNDSASEATFLTLGEEVEMAITSYDRDWFTFSVVEEQFENDAVLVEVFTSGSTDTYMEVYGPDDSNLLYGESDDYLESNAGMAITVSEPGQYWVVVRGYSEDLNGYYDLVSQVSSVEYADAYEPNNTMSTASPLVLNEPQTHSFDMGDSLDIFVVELDKTSEVTVFTEGSLDTYIELYDEYGNYLSEDDDGGKDSNARVEVDLSRGTYYFHVKPYSSETGDYDLMATVE